MLCTVAAGTDIFLKLPTISLTGIAGFSTEAPKLLA